ncbi:MAG: hypothetical protein M0R68_04020 [Bacteroidetes bacterium]|nr:hypothetical protein [Bacteroidota bacterium]
MTFGLEQFKQLRESIACTNGDNVPADVWCAVDDFIAQFNSVEAQNDLDSVLERNGTMDFYARLYCICAHIWNYDEQGDSPADSKEYALRVLDEAIVDLTV